MPIGDAERDRHGGYQPDGSYSTTADLSNLTDWPLGVTATVNLMAGNVATANDTASDTSAGDHGEPGRRQCGQRRGGADRWHPTGIELARSLVVSDGGSATPDVTVTATVNPDGSYSTTANLELDGRSADRHCVGHGCGRQPCDGERHGRAIRAPGSP